MWRTGIQIPQTPRHSFWVSSGYSAPATSDAYLIFALNSAALFYFLFLIPQRDVAPGSVGRSE